MSAIVKSYHAMTLTRDGRVFDLGSLSTPTGEQTITGDYLQTERLIVLAAGEMAILWDYTQKRDFEKIVIQPLSGYLLLAKLVDRPEDAGADPPDLAPSGDVNHWQHMEHACKDALVINTDQAMIHATAATEVGHDAGTGLPALWTSGGREVAKVYAVAAWNPSETDSVEVLVSVMN